MLDSAIVALIVRTVYWVHVGRRMHASDIVHVYRRWRNCILGPRMDYDMHVQASKNVDVQCTFVSIHDIQPGFLKE